jgi:hypothetical protein
MPRAKRYTKDEVIAILEQSEGRLSPVGHQAGHTMAQHVLIADHHLTDRLIATLGTSSPNRPIIVTPGGTVADKLTHRTIWKELDPTLTTAVANKSYSDLYEDCVGKAGAFRDIQQAGIIGRYVLNSTTGQTELAKLDAAPAGTQLRVKIVVSMNLLENTQGDWLMRFAEKGNDLPHLKVFTQAWMFVDKLEPEGIHIQTFFPVAG